ncbi:MAG: inorganic diphosphatase [bacterium]|nr:inorganic diphosphatase [bacterium]
MNLYDLPPGNNPPTDISCVVEIPKGSRNKYEFDPKSGLIKLDRPLYSPMHYPGDYGFIPGTLAEDGDPLDIVVLMDEPSFPGCLIHCRPLGVLVMKDEKGVDEKILAVPLSDPTYETFQRLDNVPPHFLRSMDHFFRIYKELENKEVTSMGWQDRWMAEKIITACIEAARAKKR